jgi:hypothetical protein
MDLSCLHHKKNTNQLYTMLTGTQIVIFLVLVILLFVLMAPSYTPTESITPPINIKSPEHFDDFWYRPYGLNMYMSTHTNFPFWNTQLGSRRNMSYDIRGDIPIPKQYVGPWLQGTRIPIINKPLLMA